mmetsp:Transcript_28403/g.58126  ORF Transcript_28403/g.58126 Transcript_28403/m.58126 type:complete len:98 (-) Transcript_28403:436-729(-)
MEVPQLPVFQQPSGTGNNKVHHTLQLPPLLSIVVSPDNHATPKLGMVRNLFRDLEYLCCQFPGRHKDKDPGSLGRGVIFTIGTNIKKFGGFHCLNGR